MTNELNDILAEQRRLYTVLQAGTSRVRAAYDRAAVSTNPLPPYEVPASSLPALDPKLKQAMDEAEAELRTFEEGNSLPPMG